MRWPVDIFFSRDRGMAFFLAFLVLITIFAPMVTLSQLGRLVVSLMFLLTLIFGSFATIHDRILIYAVIGLAISTLAVDMADEFNSAHSSAPLEMTLKLACLSILLFMTLKQTFRPGPVTVYRVMGGIAGYLLIGFAWSIAYQLVIDLAPNAIHFNFPLADIPARQPTHLMYFSFITLTTVGYGDAYPVHPAARSLVVAEALIGQLYIATMIASLVGMAMQTRSAHADVGPNVWGQANESIAEPIENARG